MAIERPRTRLDRETRREQILDAATLVLGHTDPNDVTFEEIADAAGVSRALVYNYFGDRHGLLAEVYRRQMAQLHRKVAEAIKPDDSFETALRTVVVVNLQYARDNPVGYRYAAGETIAARYPWLLQSRLAALSTVFGGGPEGTLVAHCALAMIESATLGWVTRQDLPFDRAVEVIQTVVLRGLTGVGALGLPIREVWRRPALLA